MPALRLPGDRHFGPAICRSRFRRQHEYRGGQSADDHWRTISVLVLAAAQNAIPEEVVMVGYLSTRWRWRGGVRRGIVA